MPLHRPFARYRKELAGRLAAMHVAESAAHSPEERTANSISGPVDEYVAQSIWLHSFFVHQHLQTDDGRPIEILHPGIWTRQEGPDFQGAKLRIGGELLTGDVEIHLYPSGWRQHRHHLNPLYDSVILHAYLWKEKDKPAKLENRTSRGEPISEFEMGAYLFPDLETIRQTVHVEDYPASTLNAWGKCQPLMISLDQGYLEGFLHAAARERIEGKVRRYQDQAEGETLDQVLYQALMTSMGLRSSKSLFFLLSKRTPLSDLASYAIHLPKADRAEEHGAASRVALLQSILLHVARMVPAGGIPADDSNAEARAYAERLGEIWQPLAPLFADRLIPPTKRWNTGVRPVNFAHRRLAGIARLLERWFLAGDAPERFAELARRFDASAALKVQRRWIEQHLVAAFLVDAPTDFWAWHYTFDSRQTARPMMLIGAERARSVVLNALLPVLMVHARARADSALEERIWEIFFAFPPLESNSVVRGMQARLFGSHERGKELFTSEARQQALFQIFADCCNLNESTCEDCCYFQMGSPSV